MLIAGKAHERERPIYGTHWQSNSWDVWGGITGNSAWNCWKVYGGQSCQATVNGGCIMESSVCCPSSHFFCWGCWWIWCKEGGIPKSTQLCWSKAWWWWWWEHARRQSFRWGLEGWSISFFIWLSSVALPKMCSRSLFLFVYLMHGHYPLPHFIQLAMNMTNWLNVSLLLVSCGRVVLFIQLGDWQILKEKMWFRFLVKTLPSSLDTLSLPA